MKTIFQDILNKISNLGIKTDNILWHGLGI